MRNNILGIITIITTVFLIVWCFYTVIFTTPKEPKPDPIYEFRRSILIEGCEYVQIFNGQPFIHKGSCSNPVHTEVCVVDTFQIIHDYMEDVN